jgi:hypothetical protein
VFRPRLRFAAAQAGLSFVDLVRQLLDLCVGFFEACASAFRAMLCLTASEGRVLECSVRGVAIAAQGFDGCMSVTFSALDCLFVRVARKFDVSLAGAGRGFERVRFACFLCRFHDAVLE